MPKLLTLPKNGFIAKSFPRATADEKREHSPGHGLSHHTSNQEEITTAHRASFKLNLVHHPHIPARASGSDLSTTLSNMVLQNSADAPMTTMAPEVDTVSAAAAAPHHSTAGSSSP